ncbi:MAG: hypothetical protein R2774_02020 [Saprospiraceae bacterium]
MKQLKGKHSYDRLVHQYLDNQLPVDKQEQFKAEIDNNPDVKYMVENELVFRNLLKKNLYKPELKPNVVDAIKKTFLK